MIHYKSDVVLSVSPSPQIEHARQVVQEVYESHGVDCEVTSGCDGRHMSGSKHTTFRLVSALTGVFDAFDFSVRDLHAKGEDVAKVAQEIRDALGRSYDVVVETDATPGATAAHLHVEYDPK